MKTRTPWQRDELLHLLSLSGNLTGLCITGVTLFHTLSTPATLNTIADDMLAVSALMFLICTYTIFIALRVKNDNLRTRLEQAIDPLFACALTLMVATGFVMVYTIW